MPDATEERYTFSVTLTVKDYVRFFNLVGQRLRRYSASGTIYFVALLCAAPVGAVLGLWGAGAVPRHEAWVIGLLCLIAFFLGTMAMIVAMRFARAQFTRQLSVNVAREGSMHVVSIDAQGLKSEGEHHVVQWRWSGIKDATVAAGDVIFWTGDLGAVRIPERAFAGTSERDAVLAYAHMQMTANEPAPIGAAPV
jgi:hypothetical protein